MVNYSGGNMADDNVSAPFNNDRDDLQNGEGQKQDDKPAKVQYTIPGVLHFIQHEYAKFEMERAQWEVERAELQARIAFLQGERKGQENLKNDLVRRIKMLEYALRQERLKNYRIAHGGNDPNPNQGGVDAVDRIDGGEPTADDNQIPAEIDAISSVNAAGSNQTTQPNSNMSWRQGRQLLRQYLQEIGYTDTILDVRSFRVRSLLGLNTADGVSNAAGSVSLATGGVGGKTNAAQQSASQQHAPPRAAAEKALSDSEQSVLATLDFLTPGGGVARDKENATVDEDRDSDSDEETNVTVLDAMKAGKRGGNSKNQLGSAEEEALSEFKFLSGDKWERSSTSPNRGPSQSGGDGSGGEDSGNENWSAVDYQALNRKKEQYHKEAMTKKGAPSHRLPRAEMQAMIQALNVGDKEGAAGTDTADSVAGKRQPFTGEQTAAGNQMHLSETESVQDMNAALGRIGLGDLAVLSQVDESDPVTHDVNMGNLEDSLRKTWSVRYTLRSHFDCVRTMAFHPVEAILLTAGEDGTMKLWNIQKFQSNFGGGSPTHTAGGNGKKVLTQDLEPVYTFRGHEGPVLCMCLSPTGDACYTGGLDGTVRCWTLPPPNVDPYDAYDSSVLAETLRGHDDAVWSVAFHTSDNRLISASADGTLKLWEPGATEPLLNTFKPDQDEGVPTSVDFVSTDPQQAVASYTSSAAFIYDLETGKPVLRFESRAEDSANSRGQINQIVSHPTLPITITAHEDRMIRFFDNNTGKLIDAVVAHLDAVTCISIDPNGLYLLSGSHDGSLRLWNFDTKTCLQEITAHRRKFDESVMSVAFHPSRPLIASAGADGLAKVFV